MKEPISERTDDAAFGGEAAEHLSHATADENASMAAEETPDTSEGTEGEDPAPTDPDQAEPPAEPEPEPEPEPELPAAG